MDKLRIGVIGAGYWGPNLIRNFSACPQTEVVALCDADPARLEAVGRLNRDAARCASLDDMLALKLDAVAIATPVSTHFAIASRCMEAGLDVLVEKPLAATVSEARALVETAERLGRVLMVDHTYLFGNPVRLIKRCIDEGELGELLYVDSVRINLGLFQRDVNVIWDLAPHDLSIIDFVLGRTALSISAWGCGHVDPDIEDVAYVNLDFGAMLQANIHVNWLSPVKIRHMIFAGTKKSLILNELNTFEPVKIYNRGIDVGDVETPEQRRRIMVNYRSGDVLSPHVEPGEALAAVASHFASCVRERSRPLSDGQLGLRVVRMLETATRSIRAQGGRVVLHQNSGNGNGNHNGNGNGHHTETHASPFRPGQLPAHRGGREAGNQHQHPLVREPLRL
jgi:predicted dehydrogenase